MKDLIIASHNRDKIKEFQTLLPQYLVRGGYEFHLTEPEETGQTFAENAALKAKFFYDATGLPCIADDSGLSVPMIDNMPGVYSARWAIQKNFLPAMQRIQAMLTGYKNPAAFFTCALCYMDSMNTYQVIGRIDGHLEFPGRGQLGFGYDPIFVPQGDTRTFGEMALNEKNKYSHRLRALQQLQKIL